MIDKERIRKDLRLNLEHKKQLRDGTHRMASLRTPWRFRRSFADREKISPVSSAKRLFAQSRLMRANAVAILR